MKKHYKIIFLLLSLLIYACQTTRPLTKKEKAVNLVNGEQKITLELNEKCNSKWKVESFSNEPLIKIRATEIGANTGQVLYITTRNGRKVKYDVRFWACP